MELEEVKQFIEDNKDSEDVQEYLNSFQKEPEVTQEDYDALVAERDDLLQHKPTEVTEEEQALQDKQQELWQKEVSLTLKDKGLERFSNLINVNDEDGLNNAVETLEGALRDYKVDNAYVPTEHATEDDYSNAKDSGDTVGMIKSLFGFK